MTTEAYPGARDFERHMALARSELPGEDYLSLLAHLHDVLTPRIYLEIGVSSGKTVRLARPDTRAIGIDPEPKIAFVLPDNVQVCRETSDAFFARDGVRAELGEGGIDFAFIDGMHLFEFALRDFMNVERHASRDGVVAIHDCYPLDAETSTRERTTVYWTGDVWRAVVALRTWRPDLAVHTLAAPPSGLALVTRLDPRSRVLESRYDEIVDETLKCDYTQISARKADLLNVCAASKEAVAKLVATRPERGVGAERKSRSNPPS